CPPAERQSQDFGVSVPPSGPLIQHIPGWQPPNPSRCRCRFQKTARKCAPGAGSSYRPSIITPCYDFYYTIPAPQRNGKCAIIFPSALWLSVWLRRPWPVPGRYPIPYPYKRFPGSPTAQKSASRACRISAVPWPARPPNHGFPRSSECPPAPCTHRRGSKSQPAAGKAANPGTAPVPQTFSHRAWYSILRWSSYPPLPCQLHNFPGWHFLTLVWGIVQQGLILFLYSEHDVQLLQSGGFL